MPRATGLRQWLELAPNLSHYLSAFVLVRSEIRHRHYEGGALGYECGLFPLAVVEVDWTQRKPR